jgi:DNA modification methylase
MTQTAMAQRIELRSIRELAPYAKNPRTHSDEQVDQIGASIIEFGFNNPILVDTKLGIIAGHGRLLAAQKLGLERVPVVILDHLTEAQKRAYIIADNKLALNAGWDEELLRSELAELRDADFDIDVIGFSDEELEQLLAEEPAAGLTDEDECPDPPAEPVSQPGDLWLCGTPPRQHRVLCGDSTNAEVVERLLGKHKPILMVTDPPYGIELDSEWRDRAGLNGCGPAEASYMKHRTEGHTNTSISSDTRADWSDAFSLVPSLEVAYVWHASKFTREVLDGLLRIGFLHHQQLIWNKGRAVLTRTPYWFAHEPCWFVRKKNAPWYGKPGENSTVWDSPSPKFIMGGSDEEKFDHPTQKPVELMRRPILNHIKRCELVYEPFLGSGTTLIAAEMTERVCLGIELDPKYIDVVVQRWQSFAGKEATLEGDGRTFAQVAMGRKGTG